MHTTYNKILLLFTVLVCSLSTGHEVLDHQANHADRADHASQKEHGSNAKAYKTVYNLKVSKSGATGSGSVTIPSNVTRVVSPKQDGKHICTCYDSWRRVSRAWDTVLAAHDIVLCSKNYGADGNCLYHAIAGVLRDHRLTTQILRLRWEHFEPAIALSLSKLQVSENFYSVHDLRAITAIFFVGVDPFNTEAVQQWDRGEFESKLKVSAAIQGTDGFNDIKWKPKQYVKDLESGKKNILEIAKEVYRKLCQVRSPQSWGSHEDMEALASALNLDIYLFHSDEIKIQLIGRRRLVGEPRPSLILYYYEMRHFDGAGIIKDVSKGYNPIISMFASKRFPQELEGFVEHIG